MCDTADLSVSHTTGLTTAKAIQLKFINHNMCSYEYNGYNTGAIK